MLKCKSTQQNLKEKAVSKSQKVWLGEAKNIKIRMILDNLCSFSFEMTQEVFSLLSTVLSCSVYFQSETLFDALLGHKLFIPLHIAYKCSLVACSIEFFFFLI
jgi:hypothetical protein